ncbi:DUF6265 family protein [Chitinophaga polysaccharea]|uniref:DUF6265 family protein n=1 Tax=Chitinophaga polysaccharea TaxID=1293035 RepID=UPI001157FF70|nr:DUF6265 family protein [Chitinophaga polysaccharea]
MKRALLSCVLTIFTTAVSGQGATDFPKLNWLEGSWKKMNTKPGRSGHEKWESITPSPMKGIGITLQGKDTVFWEKLELVVKEDAIYYVADVQGNKEPTWFKITSIGNNGFTCENDDHDFPKKIVYEKEDRKMKVTISGNGKSVGFLFEKG